MFTDKMKSWILFIAIIIGLLILTHSCTKEEPAAAKLEIGQNYEGGIIFYVDP